MSICASGRGFTVFLLSYMLLKSDVTRSDHVSVIMDAGSRIHQFHSQFHSRRYSLRIILKYTILVRMRISPREPARHDNGASDVWALTAYC